MEPARKKRKENWTEREVSELQNAYLELRSTVEGRLGPSLSNTDKENAWKCIHERINAQGTEFRSIPEIKKKLSDIKSGLKKRERERRLLSQQTGGGPPPTLSSSDEKMVQAIGEVAISGFCGPDTFDTFDPINDYLPVTSQQPQTTTFLPHTSTCYLPPTFTMKSQSFTTTCKGKSETAKDSINDYFPVPSQQPPTAILFMYKKYKDETIKITTILNQHTELLQSILDEQRRTNHILGQLFSVNIEHE